MGKRFWSLVLSVALIGGVFSALPATAQEAPAVPAAPNIVDPVGDANLLNSGTAGPLGQDNVTPVDASSLADLVAVWFSHTADSISVHWQTEAAPPGGNGVGYQAFASPGEGEAGSNTTGCLRFLLNIPGTNPGGGSYQDKEWVRLLDRCNVGTSIFDDAIDGTYSISEGPDATGIITATFPRSYSPLLADGGSLSTPTASANSPLIGEHTNVGYISPSTDNTKPGTDYVLSGPVAGGPGQPSEPNEPPGKSDPPGKGKKKGCGKGNGKQKGACPGNKPGKPKPPVASCAPYKPGEEGAEAETTIVTDAATEEKPVELDFDAPAGEANDLGLGVYDGTASLYQNIQVDTQSADTGLYVRYEFPDRHDYDLYLNYPDGSTAANSGDFNVAPGEGLGSGSPEGGWEAGSNYEQVMGIRTADCAGYTARLVSYLTTGGATKLKIWLGPVVADPAPAEGGEMSAADMFFGTAQMRNPMNAATKA